MVKDGDDEVSDNQESTNNVRIKKDLQCGVDVDTRRQCQYCRYKRCIATGNDILNTTQKLSFVKYWHNHINIWNYVFF